LVRFQPALPGQTSPTAGSEANNSLTALSGWLSVRSSPRLRELYTSYSLREPRDGHGPRGLRELYLAQPRIAVSGIRLRSPTTWGPEPGRSAVPAHSALPERFADPGHGVGSCSPRGVVDPRKRDAGTRSERRPGEGRTYLAIRSFGVVPRTGRPCRPDHLSHLSVTYDGAVDGVDHRFDNRLCAGTTNRPGTLTKPMSDRGELQSMLTGTSSRSG